MKMFLSVLVLMIIGSRQVYAQKRWAKTKAGTADSLRLISHKITDNSTVDETYFPFQYFSLTGVRKLIIDADDKKRSRTIFLNKQGQFVKVLWNDFILGNDSLELIYKNGLPADLLHHKRKVQRYIYSGDTAFVYTYYSEAGQRMIRKGMTMFQIDRPRAKDKPWKYTFENNGSGYCCTRTIIEGDKLDRRTCYSNLYDWLPLTMINTFQSATQDNYYYSDTIDITRPSDTELVANLHDDDKIRRMKFKLKDNRPVEIEYYSRVGRIFIEQGYKATVKYEFFEP